MKKRGKVVFLIYLVLLLHSLRAVHAEEMAPNFTLTDIDGTEFSLSDFNGKPVLLNFFAISCSACRSEISHIKATHEEFGENLAIISISISPFDTVENLKQFRQDKEMNWIVARDNDDINSEYDVLYVPTTVIIDKDGYIQQRYVGLTDESILSQGVNVKCARPQDFLPVIILPLLMIIALFVVIMRKRQIAQKPEIEPNNANALIELTQSV